MLRSPAFVRTLPSEPYQALSLSPVPPAGHQQATSPPASSRPQQWATRHPSSLLLASLGPASPCCLLQGTCPRAFAWVPARPQGAAQAADTAGDVCVPSACHLPSLRRQQRPPARLRPPAQCTPRGSLCRAPETLPRGSLLGLGRRPASLPLASFGAGCAGPAGVQPVPACALPVLPLVLGAQLLAGGARRQGPPTPPARALGCQHPRAQGAWGHDGLGEARVTAGAGGDPS